MTIATSEETAFDSKGKWMVLLAAFLGWMFDGLEMGLFPLVARPAIAELVGVDQARAGMWMSVVYAVFLVGAACGGLIFGWLGDRIGRVRAMVWSVLVYSIFSGLCGFSQAPWQLAILRFMASLGMGGEWSLGVALVMEVWPNKHRPILAGLIGAASNVGFLLIAFVGLALARVINELRLWLSAAGLPQTWVDALVRNSAWRLLLFLGALPALLTFFIRIFVPESKRWQQAAKTSPKNRIADIFTPKLAPLTIFGTCLAAVALLGTWGSVQWIPPWASKLAEDTHYHAPKTAAPWAQIWSGFGAVIGCILAACTAQWTSRRWTYFGLSLLSLAACQYLFRSHLPFGAYYLFWVFIVGGITAAFFGWLPLYLPELFPTRVRATGQGFAFNTGRILAAVGVLYGGQLLDAFGKDYARMCSWISLVYVLGLFIIWLGPETKNRPLPE